MTPLPVRLHPEAKSDLDEAIKWYSEKDKSIAIDFVVKRRETLNRIAQLPQMPQAVYRDVRKAAVQRFPYVVVYQAAQDEVIVISITHTARHDDFWKSRIN